MELGSVSDNWQEHSNALWIEWIVIYVLPIHAWWTYAWTRSQSPHNTRTCTALLRWTSSRTQSYQTLIFCSFVYVVFDKEVLTAKLVHFELLIVVHGLYSKLRAQLSNLIIALIIEPIQCTLGHPMSQSVM